MATPDLAELVLKYVVPLKIFALQLSQTPAGKAESVLLKTEDLIEELRVHAESMCDAATVTRYTVEGSILWNNALTELAVSHGG